MVGFEVTDVLARHIKSHTRQETFLWHLDGTVPHLLGASDPALGTLLAPQEGTSEIDSAVPWSGTREKYSILDAAIEDKADIVHNPQGLHVALVQPLDEKYLPFRRLEYRGLLLAGLALALGLALGVAVSRPLARPLAGLAAAPECLCERKLF